MQKSAANFIIKSNNKIMYYKFENPLMDKAITYQKNGDIVNFFKLMMSIPDFKLPFINTVKEFNTFNDVLQNPDECFFIVIDFYDGCPIHSAHIYSLTHHFDNNYGDFEATLRAFINAKCKIPIIKTKTESIIKSLMYNWEEHIDTVEIPFPQRFFFL